MPKTLYHQIESRGYIRGRPIICFYSYPKGVSIEFVRVFNNRFFRAFPNSGTKTIATPMEFTT